VIVSPVN